MGSTPVCLCPDSLPERPLGLWSAVLELLSAKQPSQLECTSWVETLPYKALGTVASANFFFLQNKPVSRLHTSSGETLRPLCSLFLDFFFLLHSSVGKVPASQSANVTHLSLSMFCLVFQLFCSCL